MQRRRPFVFLVAPIVLLACRGQSTPATATEAVHAYCGESYVAVERRIDSLLRELTLDEKIAMTHGTFDVPIWSVPGADRLQIPALVMLDGPRGASSAAGNATAFPVAAARGATFDPDLERRVGAAIAHEVRAYGRSVLLAPTVNVLRHPRWGRAQETYGEDPFHLGTMGIGFVSGAQTELPVMVKHFAANSIENTRHVVDVTIDPRTLREIYLPHFHRIVRDGHVAAVMSAYNSVNGRYCSENPTLLHDILKTEWQFAGPVVSDWFGTEPNVVDVDHTVRAVEAGLDIEMPVEGIYGGALSTALYEHLVDESQVDAMIRRRLRLALCHALDANPPVADPTQIETADARSLAREVAERSIVLLQNTGSILPIARTPGASIVITGPLADVENLGDYGSSRVVSSNVVTAYEGLVANAGGTTVTLIANPPTAPADQTAITNADVVIVVAGLTHLDEGEADIGAGDRASLALSSSDTQWIADVAALSNRVVLVLEGGSALTVGSVLPTVEAALMAWYPGVEGGNALARVLFGDVNPSGRLPVAFPVAESDLPTFDNVSTAVTYGYFHGYRHLDAMGTAPLFPFGFGLSYTSYAYSGLALESSSLTAADTIRASLVVSNTGAVAGRETVQLYVGPVTSGIAPRSVRELRAFTQVDLLPGESKTVSLAVPVADLAYWDAASNGYLVEPTSYRIEVGPSSRDLPLVAEVAVAP